MKDEQATDARGRIVRADSRAAILTRLAVAVVLAVLLGLVSALWLPQGTALVTIPWGIVAILLGATFRRRRAALLVGGVFGFVAAYAYLWFDDRALPSGVRLLQLALVIVLPAAFGFCCGALAAWLGCVVARSLRRRAGDAVASGADPGRAPASERLD